MRVWGQWATLRVWLRGQGWEGSERAGAPFTSFYWLHSVSAIKMERIKFSIR